MSYLSEIRAVLAEDKPDLSKISIKEISYALTDIIGQVREARWRNREEANRLQAGSENGVASKGRKASPRPKERKASPRPEERKASPRPEHLTFVEATAET